MAQTVLGIFADSDNAAEAINELNGLGYNPKDISIVVKDRAVGQQIASDTGTSAVSGAVSGATTGAVLGGLAGLVAAIAIPGIGAFFIGGPIAVALGLTGAAATTASGVVTGAVAGGFLGALMGLGLSKDEAQTYEERIREGGILVAVPARPGEQDEVENVLLDQGANDVKTVSTQEAVAEFEDDGEYVEESPSGQYAYAGVKGGKTRKKVVQK